MQSNKPKTKKDKPKLRWQVGPYSRIQQYRFILPYGFLLLCRLWNTKPETLLVDFMDNLSFGSLKREGRDDAKAALADYILHMGYGQEHYSVGDIQSMFRELDAVGLLFPKDAANRLVEAHVKWRDLHYTYWFNNWFGNVRHPLLPPKQRNKV